MDPFIGQICMFGFDFAPYGWAFCAGQTIALAQQQALFALLGTTYGGNGTTNFMLPNLQSRLPRGQGQGQGLSNVVMGEQDGAERAYLNGSGVLQFLLSAAQIPGHTHPANFAAATGSVAATLPATTGSGSISVASTSIDVVPGATGVNPSASTDNYYLTGVKSPSTGPVTTTAPGSNKATLRGVNVALNTTGYVPPTPAQNINITTVTGGTVTVNSQNSAQQPVAVQINPIALGNPTLGLNFSIAMMGVYPTRG